MAQRRDYKPRSAKPKRQQKAGMARWLVFVIGFAVGVGVTAAALESGLVHRLAVVGNAAPAAPAVNAAPESTEPEAAKKDKLRFEFYSLLPEAEVVVTESELARQREKKPAPVSSQPATEPLAPVETASPSSQVVTVNAASTESAAPVSSYMLQVGSFRKNAQAEQLRARLALLGLQARIEKVTVDGKNGKSTWHRVRLGPFNDVGQLDQARGLLGKDGVQSLVIKARG